MVSLAAILVLIAVHPAIIRAGTPIRLAGGDRYSGTIQVFHNNRWGSVCDDGFNTNAARVVCRMLGFHSGLAVAYDTSHFGSLPEPTWLDSVQCRGNELDIDDCRHAGWGIEDCSHSEDAGVRCQPRPIASVNPSFPKAIVKKPATGNIVIQYVSSVHFHLCSSTFDDRAATVLCKMAGSNTGIKAVEPSLLNDHSIYFVHADFHCQGTEADLSTCMTFPDEYSACSAPSYIVAALCADAHATLEDGDHPWDGRVEVHRNGVTTAICGEDWTDESARVVCRMMGYGERNNIARAYTKYNTVNYGKLESIICNGTESSLDFCTVSDVTSTCPSFVVAAVQCAPPDVKDAVSFSCTPDGWSVRVNMTILTLIYPDSWNQTMTLGGVGVCTGEEMGDEIVFGANYTECNTKIQEDNDYIIYNNHLEYAEHELTDPDVVDEIRWQIGLTCKLPRNETFDKHLTPVEGRPIKGGTHIGHFNETLQIYSDPAFRHKLQGPTVSPRLGDTLFVEVTTSADDDVKMIVDSCYAKPSEDSTHETKVLIQNGCEVDPNTHVIRYSAHETRFFYTAFEFDNGSTNVYLYCDVRFCNVNDQYLDCRHGCHSHNRAVQD